METKRIFPAHAEKYIMETIRLAGNILPYWQNICPCGHSKNWEKYIMETKFRILWKPQKFSYKNS